MLYSPLRATDWKCSKSGSHEWSLDFVLGKTDFIAIRLFASREKPREKERQLI